MSRVQDYAGIVSERADFVRRLRRDTTLAETRLWARIRNGSLGYRVRRQHPIGRFVADFYCHEARLVIEVDGPVHETQVEHDAGRDAWMADQGIAVIRFANDQVLTEMSAVLDVIASAITGRVGEA